MILRGVDGCPGGWIAADLDLDTNRVTARVFPADAKSLLFESSALVTAIDIPIGLPSAHPRRIDGEVRKLLGPRASSVFPAPARASLAAQSYEEACALSQAACGKSLSQQAYGILPKIKTVDTVLQQNPGLAERVLEIHPELCFYFWAGERPMRYPKKSGFGFVERYRLAQEHFGNVVEEIRDAVPASEANDDDVLDALAALWTAQRIHSGHAVRLPAVEERDERGLLMQMLA